MKVWELINALQDMPFDAEIVTLTRPKFGGGGLWEQQTVYGNTLTYMEKDHPFNQIKTHNIVVIY